MVPRAGDVAESRQADLAAPGGGGPGCLTGQVPARAAAACQPAGPGLARAQAAGKTRAAACAAHFQVGFGATSVCAAMLA